MAQRKYKTYSRLRQKLQRLGCLRSARLATLLLDTFVWGDGCIYAKSFYEGRFGTPNQRFIDWIADLRRLGVLGQEIPYNLEDKKLYAKYIPGPSIAEYINDERKLTAPFATSSELLAVSERLEKTEKIIVKLCQKLGIEPDPPKYLRLVKALGE